MQEAVMAVIRAQKERDEALARARALEGLEGDSRMKRLSELDQLVKPLEEELASLRAQLQEIPQFKDLDKRMLYRRICLLSAENRALYAKLSRMEVAQEPGDAPKDATKIVELRMAERKALKELEACKKELADLRELAQKKDGDLREELLAERMINEELTRQLDELAKSYEDMQAQNARLLKQAAEREQANSKLASERVKAMQQISLLKEERDKLKERIRMMGERMKQLDVVAEKKEEMLKAKEELVKHLRKEQRLQEEEIRRLRVIERTVQQVTAETREQVEALKAQLAAVTKSRDEYAESQLKLDKRIREFQEEIKVLRRREAHWQQQQLQQAQPGQTVDKGLTEELRQLKHRLKCNVCSDREKNVVITKCFHAFCRDCIEGRLKARLRKCPRCQVPFGQEDVKALFL